ncbi:hypothetical protein PUN4_1090012 [Paraburkholderia unamae]|nr:hypothetical protein PUN4_1090012 [Paraburkholderia unamae]
MHKKAARSGRARRFFCAEKSGLEAQNEIVKFTYPVLVRRQALVVVARLTLLPGIISDTLTPFMVVERVTREAGTR